ncbi:MAG: DNA methyltransferase [Promethearchaeota archaeon]|jgi:adenine-specific DNA-methyltransferase
MKSKYDDHFKTELLKLLQPSSHNQNFGIHKLLNSKRVFIEKIVHELASLKYSDEVVKEIYDSILQFFSLYYLSGHFIINRKNNIINNSRIQFNGEDVILHWTNMDKHYVKTVESKKDSGRKETQDYFIHKNLQRFFEHELRAYISNVILPPERISNLDDKNLTLDLNRAKTIKEIVSKLIEPLAQFEIYQLKLWKKRKHVLKTNYIITLDKIEEYTSKSFLNSIMVKIINNKLQIQEWKDLFKIKSPDLSENAIMESDKLRTLPLDTKYFDENFKWNLLTALTKDFILDDILNGILIKSDNIHALNLILKRFEEQIKLIYIDPPYNTGHDYPVFKNNFLDSSWLGMMYDRLTIAQAILNREGNMFVRIDHNGNQYIRFLLDIVFGKNNFRNELIVNKTKAKKQIKKPFIQQTESLFYYSKSEDYYFDQLMMPRKSPQWYELLDLPRANQIPRKVLGKIYYPPKNRRWGLSQERIDSFEQRKKIRINTSKS